MPKSGRIQSWFFSVFPFAVITLQSHGLTITQSLGLPVSLAVARIQGFSCFDNSMLTQVRTAVFQSKTGLLWWSILRELDLRAGSGFYIHPL